MTDKSTQQWAFIFHTLGKEALREMLFKAAMRGEDEGRVVIEFTGDNAMDITDHVDELESDIEQ